MMPPAPDPRTAATCRHCGDPLVRDAAGRWAHEYRVRGELRLWFFCERGTTQPAPADELRGGRDGTAQQLMAEDSRKRADGGEGK